MITLEQFNLLLPLACKWVEQQEVSIKENGMSLTPSQIEDATRIGVKHPEKVRLLQVASIPIPKVLPIIKTKNKPLLGGLS